MSETESALLRLALGDELSDDNRIILRAAIPIKPLNEARKLKKMSTKKSGEVVPFDPSTMIESENVYITEDESAKAFSFHHLLHYLKQKVEENVTFYCHSLKSFMFNRNSDFSNFIFVFTLLLLFIAEAIQRSNSRKFPVYNLLLILFLHFFQVYKANLDTYLVLTVITLSSILLDLVYVCYNTTDIFITLTVSIVTLAKLYYVALYLQDDFSNTKLARKYLIRRFRLFLCYSSATIRDSRIMREIRGIILAFSILQNISLMFYCIELYYSLTTFSKANNRIFSYPHLGIPISIFLVFKILCMALLAGLILWDTQIILCFHHFGCCSTCCSKFIQNYYNKLAKKYGGDPYIYAFHRTRYKQMRLIKSVDIAYSLAGWITILYYFFNSEIYDSKQTDINVYLVLVLTTLLVSDLWGSLLLFRNINGLLIRYDQLRREVDVESDDSEMEELNLKRDRDIQIIY